MTQCKLCMRAAAVNKERSPLGWWVRCSIYRHCILLPAWDSNWIDFLCAATPAVLSFTVISLNNYVCLFVFQKHHLIFSPGVGSVPYSPESPAQLLCSPLSLNDSGSGDENIKRGRPPTNAIQALISQGSVAESSIRCQFCSRVFPREKSLQAHMRTHTGL